MGILKMFRREKTISLREIGQEIARSKEIARRRVVWPSHETWIGQLPVGLGVQAMTTATINEAIRHSRIGKIALKHQ